MLTLTTKVITLTHVFSTVPQGKAGKKDSLEFSLNSRIGINKDTLSVVCDLTGELVSSTGEKVLSITYRGSFTASSLADTSDAALTHINTICTAKIFPYLRELVADLTRKMSISIPVEIDFSWGDEETLLTQQEENPPPSPPKKPSKNK